jgi:hypothetical protein
VNLDDRISAAKGLNLSPLHPDFSPTLFRWLAEKIRSTGISGVERIVSKQYAPISQRLEETWIQEGCSVRNVLRTTELAIHLIDEQGNLREDQLALAIVYMEQHLYSLGPNRQHDAMRQRNILRALKLLKEGKEFKTAIKTISKPIGNQNATNVIRATLKLPEKISVTDAHTRQAVLAAWLSTLRQSVGSCFGTAPSIMLHDEQPLQFLEDLKQLIATGQLKRIFGGVEYSVPFSPSWGVGDLRKSIPVPRIDGDRGIAIWNSPGMISALEEGGLIPSGIDYVEKEARSKKLVLETISERFPPDSHPIATPEEILRWIFMREQKLTDADIEDLESRPRHIGVAGILVARSIKGGKEARFDRYKELYQRAQEGFKSIAENPLLKSWEFSIASFAETKMTFSRWNLYASLGFDPNERGGLGECLLNFIKERLDQANERVHDLQNHYEMLYVQVRGLEARIARAETKADIAYLRADYELRSFDLRSALQDRDHAHSRAKRLSNLYDDLIHEYDKRFPQYFQEIYDAEMHDIKGGPYDDSPAGFRLVYKHGRSNTSQWTMIRTPGEYIDSLAAFFIATENEISSQPEFALIQQDLSEVSSRLISHVKSVDFIDSSFYRMAKAHNVPYVKDPLKNLDRIDKKPWVYTSGGTMAHLVSVYFRREDLPSDVSRWVESPAELLVFLLDSIKDIPKIYRSRIERGVNGSMLMHSPTHAFLLKPNMEPFRNGWLNEEYTFTWVRDHWLSPMEEFVSGLYLDGDQVKVFLDLLEHSVPENYRPHFRQVFARVPGRISSVDLRDYIVSVMAGDAGFAWRGHNILPPGEIESLMYNSLPMLDRERTTQAIRRILFELPGYTNEAKVEEMLDLYEELSRGHYEISEVTSFQLRETILTLILIDQGRVTSPIDYHDLIAKAASKLRYAMPQPIVIADTNWVKDYFAFVVNPGSGELDFWRVDSTGLEGSPMDIWKQWLDGSQKKPDWGIYNDPRQYMA